MDRSGVRELGYGELHYGGEGLQFVSPSLFSALLESRCDAAASHKTSKAKCRKRHWRVLALQGHRYDFYSDNEQPPPVMGENSFKLV